MLSDDTAGPLAAGESSSSSQGGAGGVQGAAARQADFVGAAEVCRWEHTLPTGGGGAGVCVSSRDGVRTEQRHLAASGWGVAKADRRPVCW